MYDDPDVMIRIKKSLRDKLKGLGKKGDTYSEIIERQINRP